MLKNKGITLIALVVTIIILLLLAGISITMLTGQNGILNRATEAKEQTIIASKKEEVDMAILEVLTANERRQIKSYCKQNIRSNKI